MANGPKLSPSEISFDIEGLSQHQEINSISPVTDPEEIPKGQFLKEISLDFHLKRHNIQKKITI